MAGEMLQSSETATRNGIQALEMAYSGIFKCRQDVTDTRVGLNPHLGGAIGAKYDNLIRKWEDKADLILNALESMVNELNETLRVYGLQEGSSLENIDQQYAQDEEVFDALTGR
ncbi:hypothetical protein [Streptomyces sp. DH37]|jgi:early secretory antigenic target protein ESAT-6|uniref:hypothetical protein n=1 Tax=Streptomyces sp. DH37 TaxID=3040122 RepID=UPI002440F9ED|nr:hypothetical protein [Streptomyces sp. DH37]MDG9706294.1 hypothetical protein [Streptomyces sp. DH37]